MTEDLSKTPGAEPQSADVELSIGKVSFRARVQVTPTGLLSIGALVSGILLSTAAVVWVSTSMAREHPVLTRLRPR